MAGDGDSQTPQDGDNKNRHKKDFKKRAHGKKSQPKGSSVVEGEGPEAMHPQSLDPSSSPLGAVGGQSHGKSVGKKSSKQSVSDPQPSTSSGSGPSDNISEQFETMSLSSPGPSKATLSAVAEQARVEPVVKKQSPKSVEMPSVSQRQKGKGLEVEVKEPFSSTSSIGGTQSEPAHRNVPKKVLIPGDAPSVEKAFVREDEADAEAQSKKKSKKSAEDAFAELIKLVGIELNEKSKMALCLRPEFASGREGRLVKLRTNFFKLELQNNKIHQYDIAFLKSDESAAVAKEQEVGRKFKRLTKRMNQSLLATFVETSGSELFSGLSYAYDNDRILLTSKPLHNLPDDYDGEIFSFKFRELEEGDSNVQTIFVRIMATNSANLTFDKGSEPILGQNRSILQMVDIITKDYAFKHDVIYGSKIFLSHQQKPREKMDSNSSNPYQLAIGYHQSTRLCQGGIMQNIDRATAVFFKGGPLIETINDLLGIKIDEKTTIDSGALRELTLLRFETEYRGFPSRHSIRSFTSTPANKTFFNDEKYGRVSVSEYFFKHYEFACKYPNLPCVEYTQRRYIPIELCTLLPDQRNQRKLRDELIRIVSRHTTSQTPDQRSLESVSVAKNISTQLTRNQFAIKLNPVQVTVQSRVLDSPQLTYKNTEEFTPLKGSWDMRDKKMLEANELSQWACITVTRKVNVSLANKFINLLVNHAARLGMNMVETTAQFVLEKNLEDTIRKLASQMPSERPQLILVIMREDNELYSKVKSLGDKLYGIPTQIVLDKHYNSYNQKRTSTLFTSAYLCNLLLKINMKIGGTNLKLNDNHRCSILNERTMVVGIDVNHPSPGENAPSIAAVVGSIDEDFAQYQTEIRVNDSREEIVRVDLMIEPILNAFKVNRGFYPEHIIVYRDGVSEGQFATVMSREILSLHHKLDSLPGKRPELTYMIVQKRHSARFFPENPKDGIFNGNILPGSVIDTDVCHYKWFDFYLCSQSSFLGTARPGKYTVLWNSSKANADELQKATYYLCYLFARATKSIADPAPARYAHHAAARGKIHLKSRNQQGPKKDLNRELSRAVNVADSLKQILYFI